MFGARFSLQRWVAYTGAVLLALASSTSGLLGVGSVRASAAECSLSPKLVPSCGVLTGAFVAPRAGENHQTAFARFERQVGARQQIVHAYHRGTQLFPTSWELAMVSKGRTLLLNWKPEAGRTWAQVAAGEADGYIDREAAYLKLHLHERFFLTIHHEPENEVVESTGSGYTAADYRRMYRHVVDRVRAAGVTNAVFVMNYMGTQKQMTQSWFKSLWPGASYVDWVAYDPYVTPYLNGQSGGFPWLVNAHWGTDFTGAYNWLAAHYPRKPIMFAEWGVAEKPGSPAYKANLFKSVPSLARNYPKIKAMVYFDVPRADAYSDVKVDTTSASLAAYKTMLDGSIFTNAPR